MNRVAWLALLKIQTLYTMSYIKVWLFRFLLGYLLQPHLEGQVTGVAAGGTVAERRAENLVSWIQLNPDSIHSI